MSAQSDRRRWILPAPGLIAGALAVLAGCSSTSPTERPAEPREIVLETVDEPTAIVAEREAEETAEDTQRQSRRERRRGQRRDPDEAVESGELVDALADVPERALQSYDRALAAMSSEDWTSAELELEQLILDYDGLTGPYVNLAIIYQRDGRLDEARGALDRALALDPGHAAANNQLGILLREQGDFAAAEAAYRIAIESDPGYSLAYYNLGVLLDLYLGRQTEALELYETYQTILPEPDAQVGRWIIDLRRRLGVREESERVAQDVAEEDAT